MVRRRKTTAETYKPYLCRLMAFVDGVEPRYPDTIVFSAEQLLAVTATHVTEFLTTMAYGTATPGPDDHPTFARANTVEQAKKGISYFMPNQHIPWNVDTKQGNPTRCPAVHRLVAEVKKAEVRKQGRPSCAKRDMSKAEFKLTLLLSESGTLGRSINRQMKLPSMLKLQFHIICRTDDICRLETNDLKHHAIFDFCLKMKVSWSKNVREERQCPPQILIGAGDVDFCTLVGTFSHQSCPMSCDVVALDVLAPNFRAALCLHCQHWLAIWKAGCWPASRAGSSLARTTMTRALQP